MPAMSTVINGGLPEFNYPVPYGIRNTFVDMGIARPLSLDEFYEERRIHSCPVEPPPGLGSDEDDNRNAPGDHLRQSIADETSILASVVAASRCGIQSMLPGAQTSCDNAALPQTSAAIGNVFAPILRLADALPEPELGSAEMPTRGSVGHRTGNCKPCAFYHTKGCGNGTDCSFCHLCPPGEKKRRQKTQSLLQRMGL
jgi:hypothetical protein